MSNNNEERRKYARLDIRSKVNFSIIETPEDETPPDRFRAIGKNIGVEGILITSDEELDTGMILDLEIYFPDKTGPVYLEGEVKWCKPLKGDDEKGKYDIGVKFLAVDKNHVVMLVKYVCGNLDGEDHHLKL